MARRVELPEFRKYPRRRHLVLAPRGLLGEVDVSPDKGRKRLARFRKKVALQEIATECDEKIALLGRLHAFRHDQHAQLLAHRYHRTDHRLLRVVLVDVAHQGHVQLYELRLQSRKAREARITGAKVIDGDSEAHSTEFCNLRPYVLHLFERGSLRDFEDHAPRNPT